MAKGYVQIDREYCKGCGLCISFCPRSLIALAEKPNASGYIPAAYRDGECTGCTLCAVVCPEVAIEVFRE